METNPRDCATCQYMSKERISADPRSLELSMVCRRFPAQLIMMMGPRGEMGNAATWPQVASPQWCFEWAPNAKSLIAS
jgi:hypothetical protein